MIFATVLGYVANIVSNISAARKDFQGMYCSAFISSRKFDMYYFIFLVSPTISPSSRQPNFYETAYKIFYMNECGIETR